MDPHAAMAVIWGLVAASAVVLPAPVWPIALAPGRRAWSSAIAVRAEARAI